MVDTKLHREAMAVAQTIMFLRRNLQDDLARELSLQAIRDGMPEVLVSVAWLEPAT